MMKNNRHITSANCGEVIDPAISLFLKLPAQFAQAGEQQMAKWIFNE